jgi:hypothetical protein
MIIATAALGLVMACALPGSARADDATVAETQFGATLVASPPVERGALWDRLLGQRDRGVVIGQNCIAHGQTCTLYGTPCCAPYSCRGRFPNTTCQ